MEENLKRLNKFIGETGYCSRREADKLIEEGRVTINGAVPEMGTKVSPDDEVRIDGKLIVEKHEKMVYLAFNKPVGIECTTNLEVRNNIVDYINYHKRIFPIGRLDKASEGLIFMTNDGDIVNKILRARNNHEKEYTVTVNKPITDRFIQRMGNGVPILDTVTKKCKVEQISKYTFKIILTQGLNRQIRRMAEYLGYEVTALKRIRIINISLDIPVGRYRDLTDDEVRIDGKLIVEKHEKLVYLAFNKPVGIECTTNLEVRNNIVDYINYPKRIFPIGRLDKASEGLIFMTNDGDIVNKILRARNNHEKEYTVTVNKPITERFIQRMGNGVPILDTVTKKCKVEQISKYTFKIILTQGLNRQIRRMAEYLGYEVTALKRIRIINISLDIPVGRYRDLTDDEIKELNQLIEPSSKTEEASLPKVETQNKPTNRRTTFISKHDPRFKKRGEN